MKIVVKQYGKIHHIDKSATFYGRDWWESEDKLIHKTVFNSEELPCIPRVGDYFKCIDHDETTEVVFGGYIKKVTFDMAKEYCVEIILENGRKEVIKN